LTGGLVSISVSMLVLPFLKGIYGRCGVGLETKVEDAGGDGDADHADDC
jgi:hypothetical protein